MLWYCWSLQLVLLGCRSLGHPWGCCWPQHGPTGPGTKNLQILHPNMGSDHAAGLCSGPGSDFTVVSEVMGHLPSSGCPGSTPGCRQQHRAWVPPCMVGFWGVSGQWVPPAPTGFPGSDAVALPYLFPPFCSQLHPTLRAPNPCLPPWAAPNCRYPPVSGRSQEVPPGRGHVYRQGLCLLPLPGTGITGGALQLLCQLHGWEPAPAGAAD